MDPVESELKVYSGVTLFVGVGTSVTTLIVPVAAFTTDSGEISAMMLIMLNFAIFFCSMEYEFIYWINWDKDFYSITITYTKIKGNYQR